MPELDITENALLHLNNFKEKYLSKVDKEYAKRLRMISTSKEDENLFRLSQDRHYELTAFVANMEAIIEENITLKHKLNAISRES